MNATSDRTDIHDRRHRFDLALRNLWQDPCISLLDLRMKHMCHRQTTSTSFVAALNHRRIFGKILVF